VGTGASPVPAFQALGHELFWEGHGFSRAAQSH